MNPKNVHFRFCQLLLASLLFLNYSCKKDSDNGLTDADGNVYHPVTIGSQQWLVENLRTTHYNNGEAIPVVTDNSKWSNLATGAYCTYPAEVTNGKDYGNLYNWYAATDSRKIAPKGWHVATDADWQTLLNFIGAQNTGGKLKDTTHWNSPNTGATNATGFKGLPGGYVTSSIIYIGAYGFWWTATESSATDAITRSLSYNNALVNNINYSKKYALTVRCVKD